MSQQELLKKILSLLNRHEIPYMLTGSVVSSIQGEPRLSHDIDIIIDTDRKIGELLKTTFPPGDYYYDETAIGEAFAFQTMFNLIDSNEGDKIDFWLLTDSAFDNTRFSRRQPVSLFGETAWISTPEDTILAKMLWAKKSGGSGKQLLDVRRVYECNAGQLNMEYIATWSLTLDITGYWNDIRSGR